MKNTFTSNKMVYPVNLPSDSSVFIGLHAEDKLEGWRRKHFFFPFAVIQGRGDSKRSPCGGTLLRQLRSSGLLQISH